MDASDTNLMSAPSPFLPNTAVQYAWDSTSLSYIKQCPRLYQYIMIDGWSSKEESVHLRFGQEYHQALQEYDGLRAKDEDHEDALRQVILDLMIRTHEWDVDEGTKAGNYKNKRTLRQLVIDYTDKFQDDPAKTHILQDGKPAVELSFRFELDWGPKASNQPYLLCGHLDRVVEFQDNLFVMDHKTATNTLTDHYFKQFEPNNQMTLYTLASQIVLSSPIKGVIIAAAQILLEAPNRFVRNFTFRTQDQLEEWTKDLRYWLTLAESYATANYWPMNDTACDKYGGCRFRDVCSKSPGVRERWLASDFAKQEPEDRWNPLKPR